MSVKDDSACPAQSDYLELLEAADSTIFGEKPLWFSLKKGHAGFARFVEA